MTKPKVKPITESEYARLKKRADELVGCIEKSSPITGLRIPNPTILP
jgi:hypothetical protein